ncbi:MAG: PDZ domain-containing protein [Candidatus Sulfotelmatobacter sp.]
MRKHILTTIALVPLLLSLSQAGQNWADSSETYGIPSDDSGTSSYLGVDIADITSDRLGSLKLKEEKGVEVTMVDQDAPAGKAGIKEHDVILNMNGTVVESKSQLQRMIHETPPGRLITLELSRDGQPVTIKVQLADRRTEFHHMEKDKDSDFHFEMPKLPPLPNMPDVDIPNIDVVYVHSSTRSGLMVENLTPQLSEFFGAKNGNGVLVRSVEKGSRADKAGLRAGDVIVRVGDQSVHDTSDFTHALHSRNAGSVNVEVIRDRKAQTLTITLPGRKDSGDMIEQSFETPDEDAESRAELSEAQTEIAKLRPQMELAREEARRASLEMRKSVCDHERQAREQARKLKQQIQPQVREEAREELRKSREKLQKQKEQLRQEMSIHWLDI